MKGTTLGQVPNGDCFWHGGVKFVKNDSPQSEEQVHMLQCKVGDTEKVVYISNCAYVELEQPK